MKPYGKSSKGGDRKPRTLMSAALRYAAEESSAPRPTPEQQAEWQQRLSTCWACKAEIGQDVDECLSCGVDTVPF